MKARVALFKSISMDYVTAVTQGRNWETGELDPNYTFGSDYVRLTDWKEIEFDPLPKDALVQAETASLQAERERVVQKFTDALALIDGRMANLRALTFDPS